MLVRATVYFQAEVNKPDPIREIFDLIYYDIVSLKE
jgi:hypothetical protein